MVLQFPQKTECLGKFWFHSQKPKWTHPIKMQDCRKIEGINYYPRNFACSYSPRKRSIWDYYFWFDLASHVHYELCSTVFHWSGADGHINKSSEWKMDENLKKQKCFFFSLMHNVRFIDQNEVSSNQIAEFFDYQYLLKQSFNVLNFCRETVLRARKSLSVPSQA